MGVPIKMEPISEKTDTPFFIIRPLLEVENRFKKSIQISSKHNERKAKNISDHIAVIEQ